MFWSITQSLFPKLGFPNTSTFNLWDKFSEKIKWVVSGVKSSISNIFWEQMTRAQARLISLDTRREYRELFLLNQVSYELDFHIAKDGKRYIAMTYNNDPKSMQIFETNYGQQSHIVTKIEYLKLLKKSVLSWWTEYQEQSDDLHNQRVALNNITFELKNILKELVPLV